jgi:hypothetical protein
MERTGAAGASIEQYRARRSEIAHIVGSKLEHTVHAESRSIMIPIAARWDVFPVMAAQGLINQRIDRFAAALAARD